MRFDPQGGLARLAEDTGGFLVRDTNDITGGFKRIDEDVRFHYLLTYSPRERRARRQVPHDQRESEAARHYSLRAEGLSRGAHVWRLASLQLRGARAGDAGRRHAAQRLPVTALARSCSRRRSTGPDAHRRPRHDRRAAGSTWTRSARPTTARPRWSSRIRDGNGQVVQKLSQQYVLSGATAEVAAARTGEILFYREADLPPGAYEVESLVYDAVAEKGSGAGVHPHCARRRMRRRCG